jgi:hypothetical protein
MASFDLPTHSASAFLLRYIAPRMEPFQLYGPIARRPFFGMFAPSSDLILAAGHGETNEYTAQGESLIWRVGQYHPEEVKGKVIKLVSCLCGQQLGPDLVSNGGARTFLGYDDDVTWVVDSAYSAHPWDDPYAQSCFMPIIDGINTLLDGATAAESLSVEKAGYEANLLKTDSQMVQACLLFNLAHTMMAGDPAATIERRPRIFLPPPPPFLLF